MLHKIIKMIVDIQYKINVLTNLHKTLTQVHFNKLHNK